jgi:hypothetical protein
MVEDLWPEHGDQKCYAPCYHQRDTENFVGRGKEGIRPNNALFDRRVQQLHNRSEKYSIVQVTEEWQAMQAITISLSLPHRLVVLDHIACRCNIDGRNQGPLSGRETVNQQQAHSPNNNNNSQEQFRVSQTVRTQKKDHEHAINASEAFVPHVNGFAPRTALSLE